MLREQLTVHWKYMGMVILPLSATPLRPSLPDTIAREDFENRWVFLKGAGNFCVSVTQRVC